MLFLPPFYSYARLTNVRSIRCAARPNSARRQVLGQEYGKAFEAKMTEVFDRNAELERDNRVLREENAGLRFAAEEAARR